MANYASDQINQWEAQGHAPVKPNELGGRVRHAYYHFGPDLADGDTVRLCQIPKGARLVDGWLKHSPMGTGVTIDIGLRGLDNSGFIDEAGLVPDEPDSIQVDLDVEAEGESPLFGRPLRRLYETEKEVELYLTVTGAPPSADITGYLNYVVD